MTDLLVHPSKPDSDGRVLSVTPQSAGWSYVGFELYRLDAGQVLSRETLGNEICLVIISGKARIKAGDVDFGLLGERTSPFDDLPWSLYIPPKSGWSVKAETALELAVCAAPATGKFAARVIPPQEITQETRGKGTNTRYVRNILPDTSPYAETLLVVEVITPGGNWSSYPPHKHDTDNFPNETYLEETYYHRLKPSQGFAFQRVGVPPVKWSRFWDNFVPGYGGPNYDRQTGKSRRYRYEASAG